MSLLFLSCISPLKHKERMTLAKKEDVDNYKLTSLAFYYIVQCYPHFRDEQNKERLNGISQLSVGSHHCIQERDSVCFHHFL